MHLHGVIKGFVCSPGYKQKRQILYPYKGSAYDSIPIVFVDYICGSFVASSPA
jgi:hypothetical protein